MKKFFMMAVMTVLTITASAQVEKGMRYGLTFTGTMSKYSELPNAENTFGYGGGLFWSTTLLQMFIWVQDWSSG